MSTPSSNAVAQVLARGRSFLGYRETPARSNRTRFGKQYGWDGVAWCAIFVWCILQDVGSSAAILKTASTGALEAWGKSVGRFSRTPHVGDIIILRNAKGATIHTELVYAWNGSRLLGIGGNTSGGAGSIADGGTVAINDRTDLYRRGRITFVRPFHGVTTEDVIRVQAATGLPRTGVINAATVTAVKRLQGQHGLTRDGFPGPATIAALGGTTAASAAATITATAVDQEVDQEEAELMAAKDDIMAAIAASEQRTRADVATVNSTQLEIERHVRGDANTVHAAVLDTPRVLLGYNIARSGGQPGSTNLAAFLAWFDSHIVRTQDAIADVGKEAGLTDEQVAKIKAAVADSVASVSAEDVAAKLTVQTKP